MEGNKYLFYGLALLLIFTFIYTGAVLESDFGIPDLVDYTYNYPCETGFNKYEGGYVFENCYVLELDWLYKR